MGVNQLIYGVRAAARVLSRRFKPGRVHSPGEAARRLAQEDAYAPLLVDSVQLHEIFTSAFTDVVTTASGYPSSPDTKRLKQAMDELGAIPVTLSSRVYLFHVLFALCACRDRTDAPAGAGLVGQVVSMALRRCESRDARVWAMVGATPVWVDWPREQARRERALGWAVSFADTLWDHRRAARD